MRIKTFNIFTKKVDQYYKDLVGQIDYATKGIKQNKMTDEAIQSLQLKIFNDLYKFPKLRLGEERKDHSTEQVSFANARQIIQNGFTQSSLESSSTITEIAYTIDFTGGEDSLQLTKNYKMVEVRGYLNPKSITLQFHFQGSEIVQRGPHIKSQKENFLDILVKNNEDVLNFFEEKKDEFLDHIISKIQNQLNINQKRIDDSNSY